MTEDSQTAERGPKGDEDNAEFSSLPCPMLPVQQTHVEATGSSHRLGADLSAKPTGGLNRSEDRVPSRATSGTLYRPSAKLANARPRMQP